MGHPPPAILPLPAVHLPLYHLASPFLSNTYIHALITPILLPFHSNTYLFADRPELALFVDPLSLIRISLATFPGCRTDI